MAIDTTGLGNVNLVRKDVGNQDRAKPPTVAIYGAGGFGINLAKMIMRQLVRNELVRVGYFDTSLANSAGVAVHVVAGGHGGGKVRATNAEEIRQNVAQLGKDQLYEVDVAIIIFSLSGSTGSVLGPNLIRELNRRHQQVIAVCVADATSEIDATNTLASLKSLASVADRESIYLPVIIDENQPNKRSESDDHLTHQVINLVTILTTPTAEVDRNDRLNWLNAKKTINSEHGLRSLYIVSDRVVSDIQRMSPESFFESVLSLGLRNSDGTTRFVDNVGQRSRFRKDGILEGDQTHPIMGLITLNTDNIDRTVTSVEEAKALFSSQPKVRRRSKLTFTDDEIDPDTLI